MVLSRVMVLVILLALAASPGLAQEPEPTEPITAQAAVGTAFTYQGRLTDGGSPANGTCDFQFSLWDSLSNLTGQIGTAQTKINVTVSEGLFTVQLDFGADAFTGDARWLQIVVRCPAGSGAYTILSPRQPLTPAPYALSLRPGAIIRNIAVGGAGLVLRSDIGDGLDVDWAGSDGVYVGRVGSPSAMIPSTDKNGFEVEGAQGNGLWVGRADARGVYVSSAGTDGVYVHQAGTPSDTSATTGQNGFEVAGAQGYGLYVGRADQSGVYVESAGNDGVYVVEASDDGVVVNSAGNVGVFVGTAGSPSSSSGSASNNGFEVAGAQGDGLNVGRADACGVYVNSAGNDGVYVGEAGNASTTTSSPDKNGFEVAGAQGHGLYVGRADQAGVYVNSGNDGVYVYSAGYNGVYANTTQASHEWGFYTPDKIYAGTALASGGPLMLVAQSGDGGNLEPGDVVAVSGTGAVFAEGESPVALVRRAGPGDGAVMGVVYRRYVAEKRVEEVQRGGQVEQQTSLHTRSAEGPIAPGDYLLVVVLGPAQVKVAAASGAGLRPGDLLTMAPNGQAARAAPVKVSETTFYAPGAVIGQAMSALDPTPGAGLVWVLVMPR